MDLLLRLRRAARDWRLHLAGGGGEQDTLQHLAAELGVAGRVTWAGRLSSAQMPGFYRRLDALAVPSRTTPAWKEQFAA